MHLLGQTCSEALAARQPCLSCSKTTHRSAAEACRTISHDRHAIAALHCVPATAPGQLRCILRSPHLQLQMSSMPVQVGARLPHPRPVACKDPCSHHMGRCRLKAACGCAAPGVRVQAGFVPSPHVGAHHQISLPKRFLLAAAGTGYDSRIHLQARGLSPAWVL